jgi:hypothetical protein
MSMREQMTRGLARLEALDNDTGNRSRAWISAGGMTGRTHEIYAEFHSLSVKYLCESIFFS